MTSAAPSLRLRLFVVILSPLLLVSVVLGLLRFEGQQATAETLFDRGLLAAALAISRDVTISDGDALSLRTARLIEDAGGGKVFYHVTGPGGIYVTGYAYPPAWPDSSPADGEPQYRLAEYRGEQVRVLRMVEYSPVRGVASPIGPAFAGNTVVTVWQKVSDRDAFAAQLARRTAGVMGALMVTLGLVVWFGVHLGLHPLDDLQDAIERRSPDDLSRIRRAVPREVFGVVATLNQLFDQVERSIQAHQSFISDAAHQLRNPASAVLALAETLPNTSDTAQRRSHEAELISAARKSARLAEQLLSLERLRYGGLHSPEDFDLNSLAEQTCAAMAPEVLSRDIAFDFESAEGPLPVRGDPVLLGEALGNLIDNALCHGGATLGAIVVIARRVEDKACLTVSDDGKGLDPDRVPLAFRRFAQLETGEGSGLGLSIAQAALHLHNGAISVEEVPKGATLTLSLPLRTG